MRGGRARATRPLAIGIAAACACALAACREPEPMPLSPAATWLVETGPAAAGNPFEMVLFVRTPIGHRVHAYEVPELEGIDVVERRILPPAEDGASAVHREALIARARAPGLYRWPASEVRVTDAAGATYTLGLDGLELDVPSVLGEGAPPRRPRGYRDAPSGSRGRDLGAGFAAGITTIGALALLVARRRRRGAGVRSTAARRAAVAPARRYFGGSGRLRRRLEAAREAIERDADAATDTSNADAAAAQAALALRHWAADRFLVSTHAGSSEELRRAAPDGSAESLWIAWIERLAAIEHARFAAGAEPDRRAAVEHAIDAALAFAREIDHAAEHERDGDRDEEPSRGRLDGERSE